MKKILSVLFSMVLLVLSLAGCGSGNGLTKAEREAQVTRQVQDALDTRHYTIAVDWMKPLGGMPRHVSSNYELTVNGDEVVSYLPYVGEAYRLPYGGGKGLNFSERIGSYRESQKNKGERQIEINVTNEEDTYIYLIKVFSNGNSSIDVTSRQRDHISYSGELEVK